MSASVTPPVPAGDWPSADLERVAACPACGGAPAGVLHDGLTDRVFRAAPGRWRLQRCGGCRSAFLDPRPTPASIGRAYERYYTHAAEGAAAPAAQAGGLRAALVHAHLNARWGYDLEPSLPGGRAIARLVPLRAATADREIRHLPARPRGRLLDVGSGSGAFVAHMRRLGWEAEGLDPDAAAVAAAARAGTPVRLGTLADLEAEAGRFDAVTLSHAIEHLHDPAAELRRVRELLTPDGMLWIATPNLEALGHRRFGRDWVSLDPPRHLVLFSSGSLNALLRRTGFEPQPAPPPAPTAWQTFSHSGAIRDGRGYDEGPAAGARRIRALAAVADRLALRRPRLAEELVVVARRT